MEYNSSQNINLHIYDTDINVTVPREKEEQWRKAAQLINEKLNAYFGAYKDQKGVKEILYYAMIDIALNYISEAERNDLLPITNILSQLSEEMGNALK